ncbi:hypothetical protein [Bradyrhizobium sp. BRP56]|uniref:hypothetical protein n=1 Tax=Bradyrhizobium sp. BRP56 TaxID=2793819 RepID=UPI001CD210E7|nr:hypothetical protein [Bradyrhizobium sp. BRP56]MCA1396966.1 hypothetical protein [Bradyrhizobium sp. BRP56]
MPVKRMNAVVLTAIAQTAADIVYQVGEGIAIWTISIRDAVPASVASPTQPHECPL